MPETSSTSIPPAADAAAPARRILGVVRERLFTYGYNALTMDVLAHDLGMSKKTLYVHFPSKDAIIGAIIDEIGPRSAYPHGRRAVRPEAQTSPKSCAP
jgi:AcrR family transcriptional regulator